MGNCLFFTNKNSNVLNIAPDIEKSVEKREQKKMPSTEVHKVSLATKDIENQGKSRKKEKKNVFINKEIEEIVEKITKIESKKKCETDFRLIQNCLKKHFFFGEFSDPEIEKLVDKMFYCKANSYDEVFNQGDDASAFFIIRAVEIIINNQVKKILKGGDSFGELALLYNSPRSATVRAIEETYMWCLDRLSFRAALQESAEKNFEENKKFIENLEFFNNFTSQQKNILCHALILEYYKKDDHIVNEGDPASSYYIIKEGEVSIIKDGKEIRRLKEGDSFGEQALYVNSVRSSSVKAIEKVTCISISRDTITNVFGQKIQDVFYKNSVIWAFEKSKILKQITKIQIERMFTDMKIQAMTAGEVIMESGIELEHLIVVLDGELTINDQIIKKAESFGEEILNDKKILKGDLKVSKQGHFAGISIEGMNKIFGEDILKAIRENGASHEKRFSKNITLKNDLLLDIDISLEDLIYVKKLGAGQFGSVYLSKTVDAEKMYAIKCILKKQVIAQKLENHLKVLFFKTQQEKDVMEIVNFPFIMKFIKSLKDPNNVYFMLENIQGLELFDVIRKLGLLNTYESQFYVSQIILSMEYLHRKAIIYRDLKPENIMVDDKGYIQIIDLGTGKILNERTPHYMAPEIILGKGYSFPVDLWSIGICLYEFLCGGLPYAEDLDDPYDIYREVLKKPVTYPSFYKDVKGKKLMEQLLSKNSEFRVGGSYASLKSNQWFEKFDWDKVFAKKLTPPFVPSANAMFSPEDLEKANKQAKPLINEILADPAFQKKIMSFKKAIPVSTDWDKEY